MTACLAWAVRKARARLAQYRLAEGRGEGLRRVRRYALNILIALDQLGNVLAGGNNPDETISSTVGRKAIEERRWALLAERVIDWLFLRLTGQAGHCRANIEWDEFN